MKRRPEPMRGWGIIYDFTLRYIKQEEATYKQEEATYKQEEATYKQEEATYISTVGQTTGIKAK